jgi:DNA-binding transcriptional ArsR family regulator
VTTNTDAFAALADPTRRAIFERLGEQPAPVGELAAFFPVSRSAVSQHLRVLKDAGLVSSVALGTRRVYSVDARGVIELRDYLDRFWGVALQSFKNRIESNRGTSDA